MNRHNLRRVLPDRHHLHARKRRILCAAFRLVQRHHESNVHRFLRDDGGHVHLRTQKVGLSFRTTFLIKARGILRLTPYFFRFSDDILHMCGEKPGLYWQITWRFVAPVILLGVFLSSLIHKTFVKAPEYQAWDMIQVSSRFPDDIRIKTRVLPINKM